MSIIAGQKENGALMEQEGEEEETGGEGKEPRRRRRTTKIGKKHRESKRHGLVLG